MFANEELKRCQQRKAVLLQQSASHRQRLATEARNLLPAAEWVDLGIHFARKARAGYAALILLLSLWQTRKQESAGFIHKLAESIAFARSLAALWKR